MDDAERKSVRARALRAGRLGARRTSSVYSRPPPDHQPAARRRRASPVVERQIQRSSAAPHSCPGRSPTTPVPPHHEQYLNLWMSRDGSYPPDHPDGSSSKAGGSGGAALLDELVREGARRMLAEALQAEVNDYIARHLDEYDENGRRLVVRNGSHQPREVLSSAGAVEVVAPRANDRRSTPTPASGSGSPRRSCRPGAARPRRSPRCCRCCTCTGCPAGTSCPPWASSSARPRGCPRR